MKTVSVSRRIVYSYKTIDKSQLYKMNTKTENKPVIKLCPRGAQTCALSMFCDRDLEINLMILKLEDDLDVLKMYLHTENEATSLRHSTFRA